MRHIAHTYAALANPLATAFDDIQSDNDGLAAALTQIKSADSIAWDSSFFTIIGRDASLEPIQSFAGQPATVHEAPAYVSETNELVFADIKAIGWLCAIDMDTHEVRVADFQTLTTPIDS